MKGHLPHGCTTGLPIRELNVFMMDLVVPVRPANRVTRRNTCASLTGTDLIIEHLFHLSHVSIFARHYQALPGLFSLAKEREERIESGERRVESREQNWGGDVTHPLTPIIARVMWQN